MRLFLVDLVIVLVWSFVFVVPVAFTRFKTIYTGWIGHLLRDEIQEIASERVSDLQTELWTKIVWGAILVIFGPGFFISALWMSHSWNDCLLGLLLSGLSVGLGIIFWKSGLKDKHKFASQ